MEICVLAYLSLVSRTYISGVLDLFFPLKNSGRALRSIACTLEENTVHRYETLTLCSAAGFFFFYSVLSPVVIEPGSVARYDDVMGLLRHIVLVEV